MSSAQSSLRVANNGRVLVTFVVVGPLFGALLWMILGPAFHHVRLAAWPTILVQSFVAALGPAMVTAAVAVVAGARLKRPQAYLAACAASGAASVGAPSLLLPGLPMEATLLLAAAGGVAGLLCSLLTLVRAPAP